MRSEKQCARDKEMRILFPLQVIRTKVGRAVLG